MPQPCSTTTANEALHLPRILCLHGGGTNARIFQAQCRVLERALNGIFRLCFAEGRYSSIPGPDVVSVYRSFGPFKAWIPSPADLEPHDDHSVAWEVQTALEAAMADDDAKGADGEWMALMGFSQGAKVCASLLFAQQQQQKMRRRHEDGTKGNRNENINFRFGVLLAGRAPLVPNYVDPGWLSGPEIGKENSFSAKDASLVIQEQLQVPTLHVHGTSDPGIELHRNLLRQYCDPKTSRLIEWSGGHRVPIRSQDVSRVVEEILALSRDLGILD